MKRIEKIVTIKNIPGLHLRAACALVKYAKNFKSDIWLRRCEDDYEVNAKSILSIITLGAIYNQRLIIIAQGEDAEAAVNTLARAIEVEKLGES
jgi:phosphocarrier protein